MTDSELQGRMEDVLGQIKEAVEERGHRFELTRNPDFRWVGRSRVRAGILLINTKKTGKLPTPESTKPVAEAVADMMMEGRLLGRVLFYAANSEIELPGGGRKPLDHSSLAKIFSSV